MGVLDFEGYISPVDAKRYEVLDLVMSIISRDSRLTLTQARVLATFYCGPIGSLEVNAIAAVMKSPQVSVRQAVQGLVKMGLLVRKQHTLQGIPVSQLERLVGALPPV